MTDYLSPFQREIMDLVDHLRHREDSAAGFSAHIRRVVDRAGYLENQVVSLATELRELENSLALPVPNFKNLSQTIEDERTFSTMKHHMFRVRTDLPEWRISMVERDYSRFLDSKAGRVLRWKTYLAFTRAIRKRLDESFEQLRLQ